MRAFVAGAIVIMAHATPAHADDRDAVLAETLFREGRAAIDAGDLPTACAKFEHSYRLDPAPGTLLNLADCEERRGRLATAWERFNRMYDTLAPNDDRRTLARTRADAVASRLPRVKVTLASGTPANARVLRDGVFVDPAAIGTLVPIDPGAHVLVVHADGRRDEKLELTMAEGERRDVTLHAGSLLPPPPPIVVAPPPEHHALGGRRIAGLVVAGAGVLALGSGGILGGIALGTQSQSQQTCSNGVCSDQHGVDLHAQAQTQALVADVLFVASAALVATGAVLFFTGKPSAKAASVGFAPNGIFVRGAF